MRRLDYLEQAFNSFLACFRAATAGVRPEFMLLPVAGFPTPVSIYRERVYCYELYHQLRIVMGDDFGFSLSGEVDKGGHRLIRGRDLTGAKPDLLIHTPGDMRGNLVIIEVKPVRAARLDIRKDLRTLTAFRGDGRYYRAIYLIFGSDERRFNRIKDTIISLQREDDEGRINLDLITLFWHRTPGEAAEFVSWDAA